MIWSFGTNPVLNALSYCGALMFFQWECSLIDLPFFSPFLKMFLFELPGTDFYKQNLRNFQPALQYSVLCCFSTKPKTKIPPHPTIDHHHPKYPRPVLFIDHHILSY